MNKTCPSRIQAMLIRLPGLALLLALLAACSEPPYTNLDNAQLQTLIDHDIPVYDIRRPEEWRQTGVLENSHLLTFVDGNGRVRPDFFDKFTAAVNRDDPVILICRTGNRTHTLASYLMEKLGYTQVYNVRHGIKDWIREKRPVSHPFARP